MRLMMVFDNIIAKERDSTKPWNLREITCLELNEKSHNQIKSTDQPTAVWSNIFFFRPFVSVFFFWKGNFIFRKGKKNMVVTLFPLN